MISNLDKYKDDLNKLIETGEDLYLSMLHAFQTKSFRASVKKALKDEKEVNKYIKDLPRFKDDYQEWYSESLATLKQLLPDRLNDFVKLFEKQKTRREITYENYVIEDALRGLVLNDYLGVEQVGPRAAIPNFRQQLNIVKSITKRFASSLFDIKQLVQADMLDSEIESARELNKKGFVRAAGAVAGVVLENHLLQVCVSNKVTIRKKHPGINDLAQSLKKEDVINTPVWRNIQHLADLRNLCDHKKKAEPSVDDVDQLIAGVSKITKTIF